MRRTVIALALIGSLATQPTLLDTFWSFFSTIWAESLGDEGCIGDPNGGCAPVPRPQSGEGCHPDGAGCPEGS